VAADLRLVVGGSTSHLGSGDIVQRAVLRHEGAVLEMSRELAAEARVVDGMRGRRQVDTGGEKTTTSV